jgi:hypothetical protein
MLHIIISLLVGVAVAGLRHLTSAWPNDFGWAVTTARALLRGDDPYAGALRDSVPYPLPVALFGLPLVGLNERTATDIFVGFSLALLTFGILRSRHRWRLLVLLCAPLWSAVQTGQWSPIVMSAWFFPSLASVLSLVKPQIALPLAIVRLTWRAALIAGLILLASLLIMPRWPVEWWELTQGFTFTIVPVTAPLGALFFLALLRPRHVRAWLLLLIAVLPYRSVYDLTPLALIPYTRGQMELFVLASWLYPVTVLVWGVENAYIALHLLCLLFVLVPNLSVLRLLVSRDRHVLWGTRLYVGGMDKSDL